MDIVTHAVVGAALSAAVAPSRQRRLSAGIGAFAGILADADALIQSGSDPLLLLDYHRHFTHALAFIPLGALIAALLLWPFLRRKLDFRQLYIYSFTGYALSGLVDACTSYGTHLLLPFTDSKTAWNLISVFDPLFTLILLVSLAITVRRPEVAAVRLGLLLALSYLGLGYVQQQRVTERIVAVAVERGHRPGRLTVKPTLGNLLLWRSLYIDGGQIHADATRAGLTLRHYPGESAPLFSTISTFGASRAADVERFRAFSDGWLVESRPGYIGDARYAMLPTTIAPIWGIRWSVDNQLEFLTDHTMTPAMRGQWLDMMAGR